MKGRTDNLRSYTLRHTAMARILARIAGVVLLLAGIVGFMPNAFLSEAGYFYANVGIGIFNILAGLIMLGVSASESRSALWLKIMGIVYFLLALVGFGVMTAAGTANVLGFLGVNAAAAWLYIALGTAMFLAGFAEDRETVRMGMHAHGTS